MRGSEGNAGGKHRYGEKNLSGVERLQALWAPTLPGCADGGFHYLRLFLYRVQMCALLSSLYDLCLLSDKRPKMGILGQSVPTANLLRMRRWFDGPRPFNRAKTMIDRRRENRFRPAAARDTNCAHQADIGFLGDIVVARTQ